MASGDRDRTVLGHIDKPVKEEEQLYERGQLTESDRERLASLKVELDQSCELLCQRRALRELGKNPDDAKVRLPKVVENCEQ